MKKTTIALVLIFLLFSIVMFACSAPAPSMADLAKGQELVESRCVSCHSLDMVANAKNTKSGWETTVMRMIGHGADLSPSEQVKVVEYLTATYHK